MDAEQAYLFRHALLRDAAYQLQLPGDRARLHAFVVEIAEAMPVDSPTLDLWAAELANHARQALTVQSRRYEKLLASELAFLLRAAAHADKQTRVEEALALHLRVSAHKLVSNEARCNALRKAAQHALHAGKYEAAGEHARVAQSTAREMNDQKSLAFSLALEAQSENRLGRPPVAERLIREALAMMPEDTVEASHVRSSLATLCYETGRYAEADELYSGVLTHARKAGRDNDVLRALSNRASVLDRRGRHEEAAASLNEAIALARKLDNRMAEGITLGNLGAHQFQTNDRAPCLGMYREALQLHRAVGNRRFEAMTLCNIGAWHIECSDWEEAERCFMQALSIQRETGNRREEGATLLNLGVMHRRRGEFIQAEALLQEALALHQAVNDTLFESMARVHLGMVFLQTGREAKAEATYQSGIALMLKLGDKPLSEIYEESWKQLKAEVAAARNPR